MLTGWQKPCFDTQQTFGGKEKKPKKKKKRRDVARGNSSKEKTKDNPYNKRQLVCAVLTKNVSENRLTMVRYLHVSDGMQVWRDRGGLEEGWRCMGNG